MTSVTKLVASLRANFHTSNGFTRSSRILGVASVMVMVMTSLLNLSAARAATNTVTNLNDSGAGSLRQVIDSAAPGDTITFAVTGVITLTSGELVVNKDLTLSGPGANNLSISANTNPALASRVINNSAHLTINNLTLLNGNPGLGSGGGILNTNTGVLVINNSVITANRAQTGGGIFNSAGGQLQVTNTTFFANLTQLVDAGDASGAGIYNIGVATISNSTFNQNNGHDHGSGLYNNATATVTNSTFSLGQANTSAVYNDKNGTLQLNNVTITLNNGRKEATGLDSNGGTVVLSNSIISDNHTSGNNSLPDCGGKITSAGHNLIGNATGCNISGGTGDLLGTNNAPINAKLGPLTDNGGPTFTHVLLSGSPAIDAGSSAVVGSNDGACEVTDQRGVTRPVQGAGSLICDMGAVEIGVNPTPTNTATFTTTSIPASPTNTATFTATSVPASPTNTATFTATSVPPSPTNTATFTATSVPASPTNTATFTATSVPPSPTNTATFTPTNTLTSTPTKVPSATPTATPLPNTPGQVDGGGEIKLAHGKLTFGFEVKYSKGVNPFGDLTFKDRGANISLKATSFKLLNISGNHAVIAGLATVNGKRNVAFILDVYDLGRNGRSDNFMIQIPALNGYSAGGKLSGGNIRIRTLHGNNGENEKHNGSDRRDE